MCYANDIEDYDIPEKTTIPCPACKGEPKKKEKCFLCKGLGLIYVSHQGYPHWREDL